jgi:hypothetical protein
MRLYHFSSSSNRASIQKKGLLPFTETPPDAVHSGSETSHRLDKNKGLQDYVRLSFRADHPMAYVAIKDGRLTDNAVDNHRVDAKVMLDEGVLFADINAAATDARIGESPDIIDFDVLERFSRRAYRFIPKHLKPKIQAEVLVPHKIKPTHLLGISKYPER